MLFGRKKQPTSDQSERRSEYRLSLPAGHPVLMTLERSEGGRCPTQVLDLSFRGACVRLLDPAARFEVGEVLEAVIGDGQWSIRTPAMVCRETALATGVEWGLEFINSGNLFGQWDNALGNYFNRRGFPRIAMDLDQAPPAVLSSRGHKMPGAVYDLTVEGVGLLVSHVEAVPLRIDNPARITLKLPTRRRPMEGGGTLRNLRRFDNRDIVGLQFDLSEPKGFAQYQVEIAEYCQQRELELAQWEQGWDAVEQEPTGGALPAPPPPTLPEADEATELP